MTEKRNGLIEFELKGDLTRFDEWMALHGNADFRQAIVNEIISEPRLKSQPFPDVDVFRFRTVKSLIHGGRYFAIGFVIDDEYRIVTVVYARGYSNIDKALNHLTSASLRGVAERLVETMIASPFM